MAQYEYGEAEPPEPDEFDEPSVVLELPNILGPDWTGDFNANYSGRGYSGAAIAKFCMTQLLLPGPKCQPASLSPNYSYFDLDKLNPKSDTVIEGTILGARNILYWPYNPRPQTPEPYLIVNNAVFLTSETTGLHIEGYTGSPVWVPLVPKVTGKTLLLYDEPTSPPEMGE